MYINYKLTNIHLCHVKCYKLVKFKFKYHRQVYLDSKKYGNISINGYDYDFVF